MVEWTCTRKVAHRSGSGGGREQSWCILARARGGQSRLRDRVVEELNSVLNFASIRLLYCTTKKIGVTTF